MVNELWVDTYKRLESVGCQHLTATADGSEITIVADNYVRTVMFFMRIRREPIESGCGFALEDHDIRRLKKMLSFEEDEKGKALIEVVLKEGNGPGFPAVVDASEFMRLVVAPSSKFVGLNVLEDSIELCDVHPGYTELDTERANVRSIPAESSGCWYTYLNAEYLRLIVPFLYNVAGKVSIGMMGSKTKGIPHCRIDLIDERGMFVTQFIGAVDFWRSDH